MENHNLYKLYDLYNYLLAKKFFMGFIANMTINNINTPLYFCKVIKKAEKTTELLPVISSAKKITLNDFPVNRTHFISFSGEKYYTEQEKLFITIKNTINNHINKFSTQEKQAKWDFYINSTNENLEKYREANKNLGSIYNNPTIFKELKNLKNLPQKDFNDPVLKKQLNEILEDFVIANNPINNEINKLELDIYSKSNTSSYDDIAKDMIKLTKLRNELVKSEELGYKNYYSYKLKKQGINEKELSKILEYFNPEKTQKLISAICKIINDSSNIETHNSEINKYIKNNEKPLEISKEMYKRMGFDKDNITYDIYPGKNKVNQCYTFAINTPKDVRILANIQGNALGLKNINHEKGHGIYFENIPNELSFEDKKVASIVMAEAIAILMETLPYREPGFLTEVLNLPENSSKKLPLMYKYNLISNLLESLKITTFEKKLYENPDQDLGNLWSDLNNQYNGFPLMDEYKNTWALVPHYLTAPGYYSNYLMANIIAEQIYKSLTKQVGKMTKTSETANILKEKLFKHGGMISTDEAMENLTGSKVKMDSFIEEIEKLF